MQYQSEYAIMFTGALICFDLLMHQGVETKPSDVTVVENPSQQAKVCGIVCLMAVKHWESGI